MVAENIEITIAFVDPSLDLDEQNEETENLLIQMQGGGEVEAVHRVRDPNPPEGNKSLSGFIVGLLTAEVNPANVKSLFGFLSERLGGKQIELTVKAADGRELSIKASSQAEFEFAMQKAKDFLSIT